VRQFHFRFASFDLRLNAAQSVQEVHFHHASNKKQIDLNSQNSQPAQDKQQTCLLAIDELGRRNCCAQWTSQIDGDADGLVDATSRIACRGCTAFRVSDGTAHHAGSRDPVARVRPRRGCFGSGSAGSGPVGSSSRLSGRWSDE
jgi:hypothetical protein